MWQPSNEGSFTKLNEVEETSLVTSMCTEIEVIFCEVCGVHEDCLLTTIFFKFSRMGFTNVYVYSMLSFINFLTIWARYRIKVFVRGLVNT